MRNGKATSVNAARKLGDLYLTTRTYWHTIQMDSTISLLDTLHVNIYNYIHRLQ